jgi:ankyrin repeat protein
MLLEFGIDKDAKDSERATPIFYAAKFNRIKCLEVLLSYGVSLYDRKSNGNSLIHEAAMYESIDAISILSSYGAPTKLRNKEGLTPLEMAQRSQKKESVRLLMRVEKAVDYKNAMDERDEVVPRYEDILKKYREI